jgi:hypothetical protein
MLFKHTLLNFGSSESKTLNRDFNNLISKMLQDMSDEEILRVYTYDIILNEWLMEDKVSYLDEFKYRLTDGEDINEIFIDIILKDELPSNICKSQIMVLEDYISEDKLKIFYE